MEMVFAKRGYLDIIYDILNLSRKPTNKTHILYKCNLSYELLQKYLGYLISRELIGPIEKNGREFFQTTDKGRGFLNTYRELENFNQIPSQCVAQ